MFSQSRTQRIRTGGRATASRRLRRGLVAVTMAAALPAAFMTSQAAAYHAPLKDACSFGDAQFSPGSSMTYWGPDTAEFCHGSTYKCKVGGDWQQV